jgi:hypothetical protein
MLVRVVVVGPMSCSHPKPKGLFLDTLPCLQSPSKTETTEPPLGALRSTGFSSRARNLVKTVRHQLSTTIPQASGMTTKETPFLVSGLYLVQAMVKPSQTFPHRLNLRPRGLEGSLAVSQCADNHALRLTHSLVPIADSTDGWLG